MSSCSGLLRNGDLWQLFNVIDKFFKKETLTETGGGGRTHDSGHALQEEYGSSRCHARRRIKMTDVAMLDGPANGTGVCREFSVSL